MIETGYLKFFKEPAQWFDMNMFFATVGFCGIWDAAEIIHPDGSIDERVAFMKKIADMMVEKTKDKSNGIKFNVEEVPSESAAGTMCKFNAEDYGEEKEYYSNQFIPLDLDIPLNKRIEVEAKLQGTLTGGGMTFLNFDSEISPEQSYEIHKYLLLHGFTGQFCINYGHSKCKECGIVEKGLHLSCSECDSTDVDFYTRVVGYLAKQDAASYTKQVEIDERIYYKTETEGTGAILSS